MLLVRSVVVWGNLIVKILVLEIVSWCVNVMARLKTRESSRVSKSEVGLIRIRRDSVIDRGTECIVLFDLGAF